MEKNTKIYIAGHNGMVGSAIHRRLTAGGYTNLLTRSLPQLDLIRQNAVEQFFSAEQPEAVVVAAAKVGGILANNTYRAQFLYENLLIEANIIHAAWQQGVKKLIFLGSSCIYPKLAPQPLKEEYLLTGLLEPTNEPYAVAKIAGIKLCESYYRQHGCNFFSLMPTNLYGPFDNYNPETSHVLPALIRKFHTAKAEGLPSVELWGTGSPLREFMYVEDLADAVVFSLEHIESTQLYGSGLTHLNVGTGTDLSIREVAAIVAEVTGFTGSITYDSSKPDGTPRKLMDVSRMHALGWHHKTELTEGITLAYEWFLKNIKF